MAKFIFVSLLFSTFRNHDSRSECSIRVATNTDRVIDSDEYYVTNKEKENVYVLTTTAPLKVLQLLLGRDVTLAMARSVAANGDTIRGEAAYRLMECHEPMPMAVKFEYFVKLSLRLNKFEPIVPLNSASSNNSFHKSPNTVFLF